MLPRKVKDRQPLTTSPPVVRPPPPPTWNKLSRKREMPLTSHSRMTQPPPAVPFKNQSQPSKNRQLKRKESRKATQVEGKLRPMAIDPTVHQARAKHTATPDDQEKRLTTKDTMLRNPEHPTGNRKQPQSNRAGLSPLTPAGRTNYSP